MDIDVNRWIRGFIYCTYILYRWMDIIIQIDRQRYINRYMYVYCICRRYR